MRTAIALSLVFMTLLAAAQVMAQGEVYLHHVTGQFTEGALFTAPITVTFHIAFRNTTGQNVKAFVNGFRLFTPTGASWQPLTYAFSDTITALFNTLTVQQRSNNGAISDTLIFVGIETSRPGLPYGFDGVAFTITTTFAYESAGHVICFDAIGNPNWGWNGPSGEPLFPFWSGLMCYDLYNYVNYPPQITNCPSQLSVPYGSAFAYDFNAQDPESDPITFEKIAGPGSIDPSTGVWTFNPSLSDIGQTLNLGVRVWDPWHSESPYCDVPVTVTLADGSYVTGRVVDKYTYQSLADVPVSLWQAGQQLYSAVTNSSGMFNFGIVPRGGYTLKIEQAGYHPVEENYIFDRDLENIGNVYLYDLTHFISAEPLQTAFNAFQTAFYEYFASECARVQATLDLMFDRLMQPSFSNGRALATDLVAGLPYSSPYSPWGIANHYGVFSERDYYNIGDLLYWMEKNTYLDHFETDLAGFLQGGAPPGEAVYYKNVIGIWYDDNPFTLYSMDELLTLAAEPVNIPGYVLPDFPMATIAQSLEAAAEQISAHTSASPDPPLPRSVVNLNIPGYCYLPIRLLPLNDLAHTYESAYRQFAAVLSEGRVQRQVIDFSGPTGRWAGSSTEYGDQLCYYSWPRAGDAGSTFLADVVSTPTSCDLAIGLVNYCGYWPMKVGEYYTDYRTFVKDLLEIFEYSYSFGCQSNLTFGNAVGPEVCVPAGADYVSAGVTYSITNNNTEYSYYPSAALKGRVIRVQTGFGHDSRMEIGTFSASEIWINPGETYTGGPNFYLPRADLFAGPSYIEVVGDFITPTELIPGPVVIAAGIPQGMCGRQDWFVETSQQMNEVISQDEELTGIITVGAETVWQRVRLRFAAGDVDLHLYDDVGGHLGRNYSTGAIENTLGDAVLLGDSTTEETIDFYPQPGRMYQYKLVGVDLADSTNVSLSVISFKTMAPTSILSPTAMAGFGQLRDTVSASIHLYDLCGRNIITIDSFTVSALHGPIDSTIPVSALTVTHPAQVLPDSSAVLKVSFYADPTLEAGLYYGSARLVTDAGSRNIDVTFQLSISYTCGDANGDEAINVGDAVHIINYVFKGGPEPDPLGAGDANCDATINVGDAVHIINYVFKGGEAPCCP